MPTVNETLPAWFDSLQQWIPVLPGEAWLLLAVALLISALGFYRVVYFISTGYGFSIAAMAIFSAIWFRHGLDLWLALQLFALALYGLRLGIFLVLRELQPSFQGEIGELHERSSDMGFLYRALIWLGVSLMYLLMFSPALFNLSQGASGRSPLALGSLLLGLVLMFAGLGIEALADRQKSAFKASNPRRFCDVGLFRWARCPNYSGEMLFWVGQWLAGIMAYSHWSHWLMSLAGLLSIELVMIGSTRRLEFKQDQRYGADPDYQKYVTTVPVLTPGLPIYSVKGAKIYLG